VAKLRELLETIQRLRPPNWGGLEALLNDHYLTIPVPVVPVTPSIMSVVVRMAVIVVIMSVVVRMADADMNARRVKVDSLRHYRDCRSNCHRAARKVARQSDARPPLIGRSLLVAVYAALHESAFGTKRTSHSRRRMSAFGGKADIALKRTSHVGVRIGPAHPNASRFQRHAHGRAEWNRPAVGSPTPTELSLGRNDCFKS